MDAFQRIETAWGFTLPSEFRALHEFAEIKAVKLKNGKIMSLPTLLRPEEIIQQAALAEDWEVPSGLIPFMGDMHDIICLDFRQNESPSIVFLNDARELTFLFGSMSEFILAFTQTTEESLPSCEGIVQSESWLNF